MVEAWLEPAPGVRDRRHLGRWIERGGRGSRARVTRRARDPPGGTRRRARSPGLARAARHPGRHLHELAAPGRPIVIGAAADEDAVRARPRPGTSISGTWRMRSTSGGWPGHAAGRCCCGSRTTTGSDPRGLRRGTHRRPGWLGFHADEGPTRQSDDDDVYVAALAAPARRRRRLRLRVHALDVRRVVGDARATVARTWLSGRLPLAGRAGDDAAGRARRRDRTVDGRPRRAVRRRCRRRRRPGRPGSPRELDLWVRGRGGRPPAGCRPRDPRTRPVGGDADRRSGWDGCSAGPRRRRSPTIGSSVAPTATSCPRRMGRRPCVSSARRAAVPRTSSATRPRPSGCSPAPRPISADEVAGLFEA